MGQLIKVRKINKPDVELTIDSSVVTNDPKFLAKQGFELVPGQDLPDTLNTITADPSEAVKKKLEAVAAADVPVESETDKKVLISQGGNTKELEVGNTNQSGPDTRASNASEQTFEQKVAELHAQGKTVKEIAAETKVHWKTVEKAVKELSK